MTELTKLMVCLVLVFFEEKCSLMELGRALHKTIIENKIDTLKVCVPSLLYVIQNNLLYLAASHLDAATYQVCVMIMHFNRTKSMVIHFVFVHRSAFNSLLLRQPFLPLLCSERDCYSLNGGHYIFS